MILITLDTTRADYVSWDGTEGPPELEAIFADGVRFEQAVTVAPATRPAHASMFTGLDPAAHGVVSNLVALDARHPTLASRLRWLGYRTGAVVSSSVVARGSGLDRGFDHFDDAVGGEYAPGHYERRAEETTDRALEWLSRHDTRPFFLWIHYFDPHAPYDPPPELRPAGYAELAADPEQRPTVDRLEAFRVGRLDLSRRQIEYYRALYRGEVRHVGREIGRLWTYLQSQPYGGDLVLAVVGDHGEELADHGRFFEHNRSMYDSVMRVPLALRYPDSPAERVPQQVSVAGLAATLLTLAGGPVGAELEPGWLPLDELPERPVALLKELHPFVAPWGAVWRRPPWKYVWFEDGRRALFNLSADPGEERDIAAEQPEITAELGERLAREVVAPVLRLAPQVEVDEATREMLRSLGYLQ